jgi:hypothetical protein
MSTEDRQWESQVITGAGTTVILARRGWLHGAIFSGATGVLDIYNDPATNNNKVFNVANTASTTPANGMLPAPVYCNNGITAIITTGGTATILFSKSP